MNRTLKQLIRSTLIAGFWPTRMVGIPLPKRLTRHLHFAGKIHVDLDSRASFEMHAYGHNIENNLYWHGIAGHEPETILPWIRAARRAGVVLDIGANTALYSLAASAVAPTAKVLAFEPIPRIADLARKNASLNPSFDIEVCPFAVSDSCQSVTIYDPGGLQPSSASLKADFLTTSTEPIEVEGITIDQFVADRKLESVDLIKLDVEGVEEFALRGMRKTLAEHQPDLFIEFLDDRQELVDEITQLHGLGYAYIGLTRRGCVSIDRPQADLCERNLLLTVDPDRFLSDKT